MDMLLLTKFLFYYPLRFEPIFLLTFLNLKMLKVR